MSGQVWLSKYYNELLAGVHTGLKLLELQLALQLVDYNDTVPHAESHSNDVPSVTS